jgi:6-phosphogluconolactonase/glucosamine-6-phosphate isomerase/deaminase
MATIFEAREVLLLASGANKAKAVAVGLRARSRMPCPPRCCCGTRTLLFSSTATPPQL